MTKIHDLRSALEFLETVPGQLLTSDTEVDPNGGEWMGRVHAFPSFWLN